MSHSSRLFALIALAFLANCVTPPSVNVQSDAPDILGTWSGRITATYPPNSQRQPASSSGGWAFYSDGSVITSRGVTGRWRRDGDQLFLLMESSVWGRSTRGPRRIALAVDGDVLTATWAQTNLADRERYSLRVDFRRLAPAEGRCVPPEAPSEEIRHAVLVTTLDAGVDDIRDVRFSHDGTRLAVGSNDTRVRMFDVASGNLLMQSQVTAGPIWYVAFASDDRRIVSTGPNDGAFGYHVWDPDTAEGALTTDYDAFWNVGESYFPESRDGTLQYERGALRNRATGRVVAEIPGVNNTDEAVFSYDGGVLLIRHGYEVRVFNGRTGAPLSRLCGTMNATNPVRVAPNGAWMATQEYGLANGPHGVAVWHVGSGAIIARLRAPYNSLEAVDISPDAQLLATGSEDGRVRIWRLVLGPGLIPLIGPSRERTRADVGGPEIRG